MRKIQFKDIFLSLKAMKKKKIKNPMSPFFICSFLPIVLMAPDAGSVKSWEGKGRNLHCSSQRKKHMLCF